MITAPETADEPLLKTLETSKELGFLGPGPVQRHLDHARAFVSVARQLGAQRIVDLGTGGGVPGLVLAHDLAEGELVFIERGRRRCEFLVEATTTLRIADRITVLEAEAEEVARDPQLDGWADLVTARSFAPPPVTLEAGVRFLKTGGHLVVSEPPNDGADGDPRWPDAGLKTLGVVFVELHEDVDARLARLARHGELDSRYPRRAATIRKRPIF